MNSIVTLIVSILIAQAAGVVGATLTAPGLEWYSHLAKPAWNPPSEVFGPVWTFLYVLLGISAFLIWQRRNRFEIEGALWLYGLQLAMNVTWSAIFFGLRTPLGAFVEIVFLLFLSVLMVVMFFRIRPLAAWLLVPYIAWVGFATVLNFAILRLNG